MRVYYNKSVNLSFYPFLFFTYQDIFIVAFMASALTAFFESIGAGVISTLGYVCYLAIFRVGKPRGFDIHFFKGHLTPKHRKPGQLSMDDAFPILPPETKSDHA